MPSLPPEMIVLLAPFAQLFSDRVWLHAQVLVVDEGTANLDNETEAAIVQTLARLRGEKTIIVIAHRLSVVRDCDCVYLLRQGRVRHSGRLSELFSADPAFAEFAATAG